MILKALTDYIAANVSGLSASVFAVAAAPNQLAPYVVVELDSTFRDRSFSDSGYSTGVKYFDFEVSCYGNTVQQAADKAQSIIATLENFNGPISTVGSPLVTYSVDDIEISSESQNFEAGTNLYRHSVFLTIAHK